MGAATDSAYGYKDAINKWYVTKLSTDPDYSIPEETYTISELENLGVSYSGQEPGENSWVSIEKNNVINGCLQFDEYKVEISSGKVGDAVKGECTGSASSNVTQYGYKSYDMENGKETEIMIGTSGYTVTGKSAYLKYTLTNGEVAEGTVPEACIYSDNHGGELCLKNNEYETSKQKTSEYFGYDESTWTNTSGSTWKNPTQTITCDFSSSGVYCGGSAVFAVVDASGYVEMWDNSLDFNCSVSQDNNAGCYK